MGLKLFEHILLWHTHNILRTAIPNIIPMHRECVQKRDKFVRNTWELFLSFILPKLRFDIKVLLVAEWEVFLVLT